jgi:hypothetical protein
MKKPDIEKCPTCDRVECAGCEDGHCVILTGNWFTRDCPFFKTREQVAEEKAYCEERLAVKEREA